MELKKVRSAGDPDVVKRNKNKIDPLFPSLIAISLQLVSTLYLYSISAPNKAVISSGVLTLVYCLVCYLLVKEPKKKRGI